MDQASGIEMEISVAACEGSPSLEAALAGLMELNGHMLPKCQEINTA